MAHPQGTVTEEHRTPSTSRVPSEQHDNVPGIASLVLGAVALTTSFMPAIVWLAYVTGAVGLMAGATGSRRAARRGGTGRTAAWVGIALSVAGIVLALLTTFGAGT